MRITSLGHAGFRVDAPGLRVLMDPWLSTAGAFQAAWFQFPANDHLDTSAMLDCDWVTVSHEHLDHMDVSVLGRLKSHVQVLVPRYASRAFRNRLDAAGIRNVREVAAWERIELNDAGDWLTFIPEESPMCQDAAVLVSAGGRSVLHCNDARLSTAQARRAAIEAGGSLDVLALQMSGASWHPICYDYPAEVKARISAAKRLGKFKAATRMVRAVGARVAVPFAGPPCFLDPELFHHNDDIAEPGIFPDLAQAERHLNDALPHQRVATLLPGDTLDAGDGRVEADERWNGFSFEDTREYLETYAERRRGDIERIYAEHPDPGDELADRFVEHFVRLGELSPYFLERIGMIVRFEVEGPAGGRWDVHLGPDRVRVDLAGRAREVQYRFRVASRWLAPVIEGRIGWEDLLLSLRFRAWREPDLYNDYLVGLLKHADPDVLAAVERYEQRRPDETVVVGDGDRSWEVTRFCPHAGEDLSEGAVVHDGVLRCLGHNFEFDLETGRCINARCDPIATRPLEPERV